MRFSITPDIFDILFIFSLTNIKNYIIKIKLKQKLKSRLNPLNKGNTRFLIIKKI